MWDGRARHAEAECARTTERRGMRDTFRWMRGSIWSTRTGSKQNTRSDAATANSSAGYVIT